jgi:hypothetical protein
MKPQRMVPGGLPQDPPTRAHVPCPHQAGKMPAKHAPPPSKLEEHFYLVIRAVKLDHRLLWVPVRSLGLLDEALQVHARDLGDEGADWLQEPWFQGQTAQG